MASKRNLTAKQVAAKYGFRSGLEERIAEKLSNEGVDFKYEEVVIQYIKPASKHKYTPDLVLPNGIIIETKGRFLQADRMKHLLVKEQHPELDIRFIFSNSRARISKSSKTTYGSWCEKYGFKYADKTIPREWLEESNSL